MRTALALLLLALSAPMAEACSVFECGAQGGVTLAHNVDWYAKFPDVEGALFLNSAKVKKVGELLGGPGTPASWTSLWKSATFSIAGKEFPVAGFNEKGLTVSVLELASSKYPDAADPRPALGPSQFAQYQLDRASTIAEVIASEKEIRPFSALVKMHFLVCEKSGDCAVIQFIDGKMNVYRGKDLPFPGITNSPYPDSIAAALACKGGECELADKSLWRFAEINRLKSTLENSKELTTQAYQALDHVAQDAGTVTRFQMVYDSGNSVFHVRKHGASAFGTLKVDFNDPAFGAQPMYIPVTAQTSGDLAHSWQALTAEKQAAMSAHMGYPEKLAKIVGDYPFLKTSPKLPGACPTEFNRLLPIQSK